MRLQKHLAQMGVASRRKSEELIRSGLVKVNGEVVSKMGFVIDPEKDIVELSEKTLSDIRKNLVYYLVNKPKGYVSSCLKKDGEYIVTDLVPKDPRVFPIGRLDKDSEGMIILSNDGLLTYELTHPSKQHEKEYLVRVNKEISKESFICLQKGINIQGYFAKPKKISRVSAHSFLITLTEGKNRQIRRMCRNIGLNVVFLKRVRIGKLQLGKLKTGDYKVIGRSNIV